MLRIAICDDERDARDSLRFQLEKILYEDSEEIVYEFTSGSSTVRWLQKHPGEIDLLFLDLEMKGLNGMETAEKIREFNTEIQIAFVTGYADYVFDGYTVGALDYVMKPAKLERIQKIIGRMRGILSADREKMYIFKNIDGIFRMPLKKILYFYSDRRRVFAVTQEAEYPFYGKLDEVQSEVGGGFVRIHQRYLVNVACVDYIGHDEVTVGGTNLPISRSLREQAVQKMAEALLDTGF